MSERVLSDALESMENALAQEGKRRTAIPQPLNKLELIDFSLDDPIALGKSESCHDFLVVSRQSCGKPLDMAEMAFFYLLHPAIESMPLASADHLSKGLCKSM